MDLDTLIKIIEEHRPSTGISSLPFFTIGPEGKQLTWFTYHMYETSDKIKFALSSIYFLPEGQLSPSGKNIIINIATDFDFYDEPELSLQEYFQELNNLENIDFNLQFDLIKKADSELSLELYKQVFQSLQ